MIQSLGRFVLLVHDYDEARHFYCDKLGFEVIFDEETPEGQRFLHVGLPDQDSIGIWFMEPTSDEELIRVGKQTGRQPAMVLYTDDCRKESDRLMKQGIRFRRKPYESPEHISAHFEDVYGNEIILVQLKTSN